MADGSGNQGEINETNNQRVVEIVVTAPDLIVSTANAPTTAITGSNIAVSWTTSNQGTSEASADWSDGWFTCQEIAYSMRPIYSSPRKRSPAKRPSPPEPATPSTRNIALPSNVSGRSLPVVCGRQFQCSR
ncbi:MAG UNVERIFIED_CONTAM: hypothetical protein LVR29_05980 [Microcystis novacekii LVE1205-3]